MRKITDIYPDIVTDKLTNKSAESVKKYLVKFVEIGIFVAEGEKKGRVYKLAKN
ncbi:MAG: hypothetical protein WCH58_03475 [Candidatus Saccharibacteria bacterium]